ncbi:MAG: PEGA domain-containing protein [candidate division KSB1 bacterium]|nr:PEGA domain-containing protein [candidate division KSB1 bacterium]
MRERALLSGILWLAAALVVPARAIVLGEEPVAYLLVQPWYEGLGSVTVDGGPAHEISPGLFRCPPGRHSVVVARNLPLWPPVHVYRVDTILVANDTLCLRLPEVLRIDSVPADAEVWIEDQFLGRTPLWTVVEPSWEGKHLLFRKPGYQELMVRLESYQAGRVRAQLIPDSSSRAIPLVVPRTAQLWKKRTLAASLLTLSAGILAVELRNEANQTYSEYTHAGSLHRMRTLYDRTRRLDRYSAASYAAFEIGFVLSFYCFLRWQTESQP